MTSFPELNLSAPSSQAIAEISGACTCQSLDLATWDQIFFVKQSLLAIFNLQSICKNYFWEKIWKSVAPPVWYLVSPNHPLMGTPALQAPRSPWMPSLPPSATLLSLLSPLPLFTLPLPLQVYDPCHCHHWTPHKRCFTAMRRNILCLTCVPPQLRVDQRLKPLHSGPDTRPHSHQTPTWPNATKT